MDDNSEMHLKETGRDGATAFSWIGKGLVADCCEHVNDPSASIKVEEFLAHVSDCQLLKKDYAPRC
jgi:hypothetical protein